MHESFNSLMPLIIPEGVSEYFELSHYAKTENRLDIFLVERNIPPVEYESSKLLSKGFYDAIEIQDFPIRGMAVYLNIKRRRWLNTQSNKSVHRNWETVAKGTRITTDFAAFLKAISRYPSA